MQAIQTRWIGPTNTRGSRVRAFSEAFPRGVIVGWDYGAGNGTGQSDVEANHDLAARAFIKRVGWFGTWARGATREGYVYVCLARSTGAKRAIKWAGEMDRVDGFTILEGES
jgi:hypothetical protein